MRRFTFLCRVLDKCHSRRWYNRNSTNSNCRVLDGRTLAHEREKTLKHLVESVRRPPCLTVVLVGHNPASEVYVRNKQMACARVGIEFNLLRFPDSIEQHELIGEIHRLNQDASVHGVIVQLPLPAAMNANQVCSEVIPVKDVDCFTPENVGKLCHGNPLFIPCAAQAVLTLLEEAGTQLEGTNTLMIGRSNVVGVPLSLMLGHRGATVTTAHSLTPPETLEELCRWADVVVCAAGVPHLVRGHMVKKNAVVIDVGINRLPMGAIVGDVDFDEVIEKASIITPVPGGVGPLTVVSLLENTMLAYDLLYF